jgi:hypothetical protein
MELSLAFKSDVTISAFMLDNVPDSDRLISFVEKSDHYIFGLNHNGHIEKRIIADSNHSAKQYFYNPLLRKGLDIFRRQFMGKPISPPSVNSSVVISYDGHSLLSVVQHPLLHHLAIRQPGNKNRWADNKHP